ncbi:MAG: hypothetical protein IH925_02425 [Proteobacteria bacterium]|nr:hypothetical protein [Pseudomonadota bacterium]
MHKDVNLGKKKGLKSIEVMVLVPMTSDLDIYRSAHERIKQHDEDAPTPVPKRRSSPHMASGIKARRRQRSTSAEGDGAVWVRVCDGLLDIFPASREAT